MIKETKTFREILYVLVDVKGCCGEKDVRSVEPIGYPDYLVKQLFESLGSFFYLLSDEKEDIDGKRSNRGFTEVMTQMPSFLKKILMSEGNFIRL